MATVLDLAEQGALHKLDPQLEPNEQEWRTIYLLPRVVPVFANELVSWSSLWKIEQTPIQQIDALMETFCSGATLTFGPQFKPLTHIKDGVWELKTPDVRFFGWFHKKDCFIGGALNSAYNVKNNNLYAGYAGEVAYYRNALDLDQPKFVPGDDPHAVVSNFDYP